MKVVIKNKKIDLVIIHWCKYHVTHFMITSGKFLPKLFVYITTVQILK